MIDPRAVVDSRAELDENVTVGPFAVIGAGVQIAAGTEIGPHVVVCGDTRIGCDNRIFQFASVGEDPQDKKYNGEPTRLEIGDRNQIREFTTINRGTVQGGGVTRIGDDNLLMAYTHVAHDCVIANNTILANAASLGGHVRIDDWAILGGFSIVHQFCYIGAHSFSAMGSVINKDIPPFVMVGGHPAKPYGINSEGLKRRNFSSDDIVQIKRAYKVLYRSGAKLSDAVKEIQSGCESCEALRPLVVFLSLSERSIVR